MLEKFRGCLLGLAVGDSLGAPYEGLPPDLIRELGPADQIVQNLEQKKLCYTDDTEMMFGVAEALSEDGEIIQEKLAWRFGQNYHPERGYGQSARKVIEAIIKNEDWAKLAKNSFNGQGSLGNGAAMRVAPVGLAFYSDVEKLKQQATLSSLPTHTHPIGIAGARLVALTVSFACATERLNRNELLDFLMQHEIEEEFRWQLELARSLSPFQSLASFGNAIEAHRSVVTSIICFADSPQDFAGAISRAIGQGDDVDTLAAMTGAMCGAHVGVSGIPESLLENLESRERIDELAHHLCNRFYEN